MTKEVTILGKTYPVVFVLQTILNYENLNKGKSFFGEKFEDTMSRIRLVVSAILAANKDAEINFDELLKIDTWDKTMEIMSAFAVVMELSAKFFHMPEIEPKDEPAPADAEDGEKPKN